MAIELVPLCEIDVTLRDEQVLVGQGPAGFRVVAEVESVVVEGERLRVTYRGRSDVREGPGVHPIFAAPLFETGDERYAWLDLVQAVSKGTFDGSHVRYEVAEVR